MDQFANKYYSQLLEIEKRLKNIEFGEDPYCEIVEEIKELYIQINGSKPVVITKAISQDEKNFNNNFDQYPHGLIQIVRDLIEKLKS